MIIVRTPLRVSLLGGGTDHPGWFGRPEAGAVLSATIDKYVYVQLRKLPNLFDFKHRIAWDMVEEVKSIRDIKHPVVRAVLEHYGKDEQSGYEVICNADLPARSGLGASSACTVSMLHAFLGEHGKTCSKRFLASEAIRVEQDLLKEKVGCQDQIATAYGGLNRVDFDPDGGFRVSALQITSQRKSDLENRLMLFFTGFTRATGEAESLRISSFEKRAEDLRAIYQQVGAAQGILENTNADLDDFGRLLNEAWALKRSLADDVSNDTIDDAYEAALGAGALGGALLGSGGGFFLIYAPPEKQDAVRAALPKLAHIPLKMESEGTSVVLHAPGSAEQSEAGIARIA